MYGEKLVTLNSYKDDNNYQLQTPLMADCSLAIVPLKYLSQNGQGDHLTVMIQ